MSVGQEFWIVAAGCSKDGNAASEKESFLANLKQTVADCYALDVPDGDRALSFGSFDNLIRLTDDLQKYDSQVDTILHRLERQYLELDERAEFKVKSQRQEKPFTDYIKNWAWDEAKYPKTRSISDNLTLLMAVVNKLDEEARNKTAQYNEFKVQKGNLGKKQNANLLGMDLVDVLTPDVVSMKMGGSDNDFIETQHMSTVCVILPRDGDVEFLKVYETMAENVVPQSAKHFSKLDDKDGNSVWRVVMFKGAVEAFKKQCREKRFVTRDFVYSEEAYNKLKTQRLTLEDSVKRQHEIVRGIYQAAWSDCLVAWVHIKAMRIFVESVLRFGMPPRFASFILSPKNGPATRKVLADVLGKNSSAAPKADADDGEELFPYVSLSFTPFVAPRV